MSPGERLPSDADLCAEFGVSRMTARTAMQRLVGEGLVRRERGRGTFVAQAPVRLHMVRLPSFSAETRRRGMRPSAKLLDATVRLSTTAETSALRMSRSGQIVSIDRVHYANDVPVAIESAVLPVRFDAILRADLASCSVHGALAQIGVVPHSGSSTIGAELADEVAAEYLTVPQRSPLLTEHRVLLDSDDLPIEFLVRRYAAGRYRLEVELGTHRS